MTQNQKRIISISKKLGLSHIGSNLSCLVPLEEIYEKKQPEDLVILDAAHAHLSHLVVKSDRPIRHDMRLSDGTIVYVVTRETAIDSIEKHGIHCDRKAGCDASGGSLGHGIGIGIGYALADKTRNVYVIVSDGSMQEGSNWEALRIANNMRLTNLFIHCNFNGYTAVAEIDIPDLVKRMFVFTPEIYKNVKYHYTSNTKEFDGVQGHYTLLK